MSHPARALPLALLLLAAGCGPDAAAWVGTWAGSGSINTGRQDAPYTGRLVVSADGRFALTTDAQGSPAQAFSCTLGAATVDGTTATAAAGASCELSASPDDGCVTHVTFDAAEATRDGDALSATGHGRAEQSCPAGSATVNFAFSLSATRR